MVAYVKGFQWTAVSFNLLFGAIAIQLTILFQGFWNGVFTEFTTINLSASSFISGQFGATVVLITLGATLGKTSVVQQAVITILEVIAYTFVVALNDNKIFA